MLSLVEAQNTGWGVSTYLYDPLGHRKQKQVGQTITQFVLAGRQEIADYHCADDICLPWMLTVRGPGGLPVAAITPATDSAPESIAFYHHDILGSTTAATQLGTDGPAEVYAYSDYGEPAGGSFLPYRFAGYRYDEETGLYFVQARYYSPEMGRFIQADPIGVTGGKNLYAYAANAPLDLIDPLGLSPDSPDDAWQQVWHEGDPLYNGTVMSRNSITGAEMIYGADTSSPYSYLTPAATESTNAYSSMASQLDALSSAVQADLAYANSIGPGHESLSSATNLPPIAGSAWIQVGQAWGISVPFAYVPSTNTYYLGIGGGVGGPSSGAVIGPVWGNGDPDSVLSGMSVSVSGANVLGGQVIQNNSGYLAGPVVGSKGPV